MAFISSCPKCQKPVLVPEGHGHDAVVQCPACSMEYSLGEIFASVPALIVVHPGSAAVVAEQELVLSAPAESAQVAQEAPGFALAETHIEMVPAGKPESDAIDFFGDDVKVPATNGHEMPFAADVQHAGADALFAAAIAEEGSAGEPGVEVLETAEFPGVGEGRNQPAEAGDNWGGNWGGISDEAVPVQGDEATLQFAEPEEAGDGGIEEADFASITGKPAPGEAPADGAIATLEPPKKKKRKREANPFVRAVGIIVFGLLGVACSFGIAMYCGVDLPFLPTWLQFNKTQKQNTVTRPAPTYTAAANENTPANGNPTVADGGNNTSAPGTSGTGAESANSGIAPEVTGSNGTTSNVNPSGVPSPADTSAAPPIEPKKGAGGSGNTSTKPSTPDKVDGSEPPDAVVTPPDTEPQPPAPQPDKMEFGTPAVISPVKEKPKTSGSASPETPVKPATPTKPDETDPFGSGPEKPAPEKPKTEPKVEMPSAVKPESPSKPESPIAPPTPSKPDESDPFAGGPEKPAPAKPAVEKVKTEPKVETPAAVKPESPSKPESPATPTPSKPDETDPFALGPEKPAPEKPKTEPKVEAPAAVKPESPSKPESPITPSTNKPSESGPYPTPAPAAPNKEKPTNEPAPETPIPAKPDITPPELPTPAKPVVTTPAKPDVAKPESPAPEPKAEVKPAGVSPVGAPSYAAVELQEAFDRIAAGTGPVKGDAYRDWCHLAEVVTYAQNISAVRKEGAQDALKKLAANPQTAAELAAGAKKLLDEKATKGGIVLAGKVTGVASKNGLFGTAIRMEGMTSPVMIFSAHPLDVKESQTAIVLGALVSDPAKNIPGYPGKQPVVVWADFAFAIP